MAPDISHPGFILVPILSLVAVIFLVMLISVYYRNWKETRSPFAAGLLFFSVMYLLRGIGAMIFLTQVADFSRPALFPGMFVMSIFEGAALGMLVKITWE